MSPTPASPESQIVDSVVLAANGSTVVREYAIVDLPRVADAGGLAGTEVTLEFSFAHFEQKPAIHGVLGGHVVLTCQRCLKPFEYVLDEIFELAVVDSEQEIDAIPESYDPVLADATRLDLRWLAEEQVLLALPFAPKHESEAECRAAAEAVVTSIAAESDDDEPPEQTTQRPFANLRDLLGKH